MRRGEVWWALAPTGERRPYLVLTRDPAIDVLHSVIAVPATRTVRGIPTEVHLDSSDGMPEQCALALDNLQLLPKYLFDSRVCALGPERLRAVCTALAHAVDC